MKCMTHIARLTVLALVLTIAAFGVRFSRRVNESGGYSEVCGRVSAEAKQTILAQFEACETPRAFFDTLLDFGCQNFTYSKDGLRPMQRTLQYFDLDRFMQTGYRGVCFDFSCFSKIAALVWAEAKGVDLQAYEYDFKYDGGRHAVNIFTVGEEVYFMDITADLWDFNHNAKPIGAIPIGETSPDEFLGVLYKGYNNIAVR